MWFLLSDRREPQSVQCRQLSTIPFALLPVVTLRRIAASIVGFVSAPVAAAAKRAVGRTKSYEAAAAGPLLPKRRYPSLVTSGEAMHNKSIDTDPQQQEAASPLMLVVRSFLRCAAQPPQFVSL